MRLRDIALASTLCLTLVVTAHAQTSAVKTVKPGVLTVAIDNDMPYCKEEGGKIIGIAFLIELDFLNGRSKLAGEPVYSVLRY